MRNQTLQLIHDRSSTRAFQQRAIDPETKNRIIDAALRSPTAGNMMLYSIIEIEDQNIKDALVITCDNQPFIAKAPLILLFLADYQRWFDFFLDSDVESYCDNHQIPFRLPEEGDLLLACCDALIAAQTAVLAAESVGVGSCYIGDIMENFERHQQFFTLPQYTFPITMLCFGYPTKSAAERKLTTRLPRDLILHKNSYQQAAAAEIRDAFSDKKPGTFLGDTVNTGQHYYMKKFASAFSREMNRSVQQAIKTWTSKSR